MEDRMYKKEVSVKLAVYLDRYSPNNEQAAKQEKNAAVVKALLQKAKELAGEDMYLITEWLDYCELEGYGYVVERDEEIADLKEQVADFEAFGLGRIPLDLTLNEKIKIDEFFDNFRNRRS